MKIILIFLTGFCIYGYGDKPISIKTESNLNFGTVVQGDLPRIVPPGNFENSQNASFEVKGEKNISYTIILPTSVTLNDRSGHTLTVNNFQSFPPAGPNGLFSHNGKQDLFVGATLAALSPTQARGTYTGSFVITVVY